MQLVLVLVYSLGPQSSNKVLHCPQEVEYLSVVEATSQAIWLKFVIKDFGELQVDPTPLKCDCTSTIAMTKNHMFH